jgi:large subunit ribosomal protein L13
MRTESAKPLEVKHAWHVVDATDVSLGRLAARLSRVLQGKHRPDWTPHVDCGDFVVVVNCSRVRLTGRKASVKEYQRFTGFPGGRIVTSYADTMAKDPGIVIREAVRRMLPKSRLGKAMITKLKTFPGKDHNHQAQRPSPLVLS